MKKTFFTPFPHFVLRSPLYPVRTLQYGEEEQSDIFREALLLASPEFTNRVLAVDGANNDNKRDISLYKYFSRSCTRCTPFGLFAGCSTGTIGDETRIELPPVVENKRVTRLDMQYLCALIQEIEKIPEIRSRLLFFPNDTIYEVAGKLRYVEYRYIKARRKHQVSEVGSSGYLSTVLQKASGGATLKELASEIAVDDITMEEAEEFINEIIDSHLLKSELEPSLVGGDVLTVLIEKLSRLGDNTFSKRVGMLFSRLEDIDSKPLGTSIAIYEELIDIIKTLRVDFESKFLFQADMFKPLAGATVSRGVINDIREFMDIMVRTGSPGKNSSLEDFRREFEERYGDQFVPLELALDNEVGIGYPYEENAIKNANPLIDDLILPSRAVDNHTIHFTPTDEMLLRKYTECIVSGEKVINLTDDDLGIKEGKKEVTQEDLPDTVSVMCRLIKDDNDTRELYLNMVNCVSATALLGRFYHLDKSIASIVDKIADKEKELLPDIVLAEISLLTESRTGNIASRPLFRDYVIHYLSNSDAPEDRKISVSDLLLSVRNGRLRLSSKRLGKEIHPKLSCAHNHSMSPIPVYRFLCDMQSQQMKLNRQITYGQIFNTLDYLPRLQYKNIILAREKWRIKKDDIKASYDMNDDQLPAFFRGLSEKLHLKRYLIISDSDNELFIDIENITSIRTMLNHVKKRDNFFVEEFLFDEGGSPVKQKGQGFTNEFILFFHK